MPAVSFNGEVTNSLRYLGEHSYRVLTYKTQVKSTKLKCRECMSVLKVMVAKGIEQRHLFLLYQNVLLNIIDFGLDLTTQSQSKLMKLDRVQKNKL